MMNTKEPRSKIFINPEFKKAHINPHFLTKNLPSSAPTEAKSIHFNPAFLERLSLQRQQEQYAPQEKASPVILPQPNPIIKHTQRKIVRASSAVPPTTAVSKTAPLVAPLVKVSRNKLVRSVAAPTVPAAIVNPVKSVDVRIVQKRFKLINGGRKQLYKLDRRPLPALRMAMKPSKPSVRRFSLVRSNSISPQKVIVTDRRLLQLSRNKSPLKSTAEGTSTRNVAFSSQNKKLVMININGVLYRSSANKLQVSTTHPTTVSTSPLKSQLNQTNSRQRFLTIRGTRFLLDPSGTKLRKINSTEFDQPPPAKLRRIDIGGLTYMPKTDGIFVRTETHRTRSYLSSTKQKSIQMLTSNKRKCNVPCPIYRRLGKCTAFSRGKCPKLHDKNQIIICSKFLKGECSNNDCLLSHNVTLEKMPVCHFFLEGRCSKTDCPYLHKKVSENERICEDFLKGYCPLADKCMKRHEFICPELDRLGACERINCPYPHNRRGDKKKQHVAGDKIEITVKAIPVQQETQRALPISSQRYYINNTPEIVSDETKLSNGQASQLKSVLSKVEKMKQGHFGDLDGAKYNSKTNDEEIEISSNEEDNGSEGDTTNPPIMRRPKLGALPSFIPL